MQWDSTRMTIGIGSDPPIAELMQLRRQSSLPVRLEEAS